MRQPTHRRAQRGYTLVELMVSITIALFLLSGLVTLVMHTGNASNTQNQLAQLQDNQRIAMTILTNVLQEAGYFPDPTANTNAILAADSAPAPYTNGAITFAAAQPVAGRSTVAVPGDAIAVRFAAPKADTANIITNTIITCGGTTNTDTGNLHRFTNIFQVGTASGASYLQCILLDQKIDTSGNVLSTAVNTVNLVPGLYDMTVLYGVSNGTDNNVVKYQAAADMGSTDWLNVTSVKLRLYFQLPQYGTSGGQVNAAASSQAVSGNTQYVERVIGIMNKAGSSL